MQGQTGIAKVYECVPISQATAFVPVLTAAPQHDRKHSNCRGCLRDHWSIPD